MRILVTGREGQLARGLVERGPAHGVAVVPFGRPELDFRDTEGIVVAIAAARPDVVVNAAAYTAVDAAEGEPDEAEAVNGRGAGYVAAAAARIGVPVVQISTDYVFDGTGSGPYRESDPVAPLGVYGRSKLAGERAVAAATSDYAILRTAWVYSPWGKNFVRTMLRLAETRDEVGVVADQVGCPSLALDLADAVLAVCRNLVRQPDGASLRGVFHMTNAGEASWAGFASEIFAISGQLGGPTARVRSITTADYPTPARRPANSRLDGNKLAESHGVRLRPWGEALDDCLRRMLAAKEGSGLR